MPDLGQSLDIDSITSSAQEILPTEEELADLRGNIRRFEERMERARDQAQTHISISYPWDYDTGGEEPEHEAIEHAMKWSYEGAWSLEDTENADLSMIGERIEDGIGSLVDEIEDGETPYRGLHLLISNLDGLIIWLCKKDQEIDPVRTNPGDEPIYSSECKKECLEKWYNEHSVFDVENHGGAFREKWKNYWYHRHRIMHGSPNAYYDLDIAVATLFFVGITSNICVRRQRELTDSQYV